jgi:hypothetical protein
MVRNGGKEPIWKYLKTENQELNDFLFANKMVRRLKEIDDI